MRRHLLFLCSAVKLLLVQLHSFSCMPLLHQGSGDADGLKVLMVSVDNRDLDNHIESAGYVSMAAVLNKQYADFHKYDYAYLKNDITSLHRSLNKSASSLDMKYTMSAYHSGYKQGRSSTWAKILFMWHLVKNYGFLYDYIWLIDSDAALNPLRMNESLSDAFDAWSNTPRAVQWGNSDPRNASLLFFNNIPWRDDMPCTGTIIAQTSTSEALLRAWWNYNIPEKNFEDFMEQDSLWYMLENPSYGFLINHRTVSLLAEPQFPSPWYGAAELRLIHVPNYERQRKEYFWTL